MSEVFDYAVIGGGIVGVSVARELLARHPEASVIILEAESTTGAQQTGHNSGVIHAGVYYPPGSLKAQLCRAGETETKAFCAEHGIEYQTPGKLIVATDETEVERLHALAERSTANGITFDWIDADGLREREPHINGLAAMLVPATGIVDYAKVTQAMAADVRARGGRVVHGARVTGLRTAADAVTISAGTRRWRAAHVIVCAGLQADRMLRLTGERPDFRIVPFRGDYYELPDERAGLVRHMIYPVPDPAMPFLGIHLTPDLNGRLTVGPNAVLALSRTAYRKLGFSLRDAWELVAFPGTWRVVRRHLVTGLRETVDAVWREGYARRVRKYAPSVTRADLGTQRFGLRAQAVSRDGELIEDFLFVQTERMLHVCNAPSPAATSAIPIARMIVDRLGARS